MGLGIAARFVWALVCGAKAAVVPHDRVNLFSTFRRRPLIVERGRASIAYRNGRGVRERVFSVTQDKSATLYRMVLPDHVCPFGVRAKQMLDESGFAVDDQVLESREEVDAFKAQHDIDTTPLVFIGGECIGGCDDLERYLSR